MNQAQAIPTFNLLPEKRKSRNLRAKAISGWVHICLLVGVGSFIPAGALALSSTDDLAPIASQIERNEKILAGIQAERPGLELAMVALQKRALILDQIEARVDWTPLLGTLANASAPARFDQIELGMNQQQSRIDIRLLGFVETQSEARSLVLRLEELGLIENIRINTTKMTFAQDVYRFDLDGEIMTAEQN